MGEVVSFYKNNWYFYFTLRARSEIAMRYKREGRDPPHKLVAATYYYRHTFLPDKPPTSAHEEPPPSHPVAGFSRPM